MEIKEETKLSNQAKNYFKDDNVMVKTLRKRSKNGHSKI